MSLPPTSAASALQQQAAAALMAASFGNAGSPTNTFGSSSAMSQTLSAFPSSMFPSASGVPVDALGMPRSTSLPHVGSQPVNTHQGMPVMPPGGPTMNGTHLPGTHLSQPAGPGDTLIESAKQSRTLLHSYIYDYFFRAGLVDAARALLQNAPDTPVLRPDADGLKQASPRAADGLEASTSGEHATEGSTSKVGDHHAPGSDGDSTNSSTSHFGFPSVREAQQNGGGSDSSPSGSTSSPRLKSRDGLDGLDEEKRKELPLPNVEHKHPQGFLYTWWTVHWDIYHATRNRGGTQAARLYVDARQSADGVQMLPRANNGPRQSTGPLTGTPSLPPNAALPYPFNQQQQASVNQALSQQAAFARGLTRPPSANAIAAPQNSAPPISQPSIIPASAPMQAPSPAQQNHLAQVQHQQLQAQQQQQQQQQAEAAARAAVHRSQMEHQIQMQRRAGMAGPPMSAGMPNGSMPNGPMIQQRVPIAPPGMHPQQNQQYYQMLAQQQQQSQAQMMQAQQQQQQQRDAMVGRGPPPGFQHTISRPASAAAVHPSPNGMMHQRQVTRIISGPDGQPMEAMMDASSPLAMPPSPAKRNRALGQDPNLMPYNAQSPNQAHYDAMNAQMQQQQQLQQHRAAQVQAQAHAAAAQLQAQQAAQQYAMSAANQAQSIDQYRKGIANQQQHQLQKGRSPSMPPANLPPGSVQPPDAATAAHYAQQFANSQYAMDMHRQQQMHSPSLRQVSGYPGSPQPQLPPGQHPMYAQQMQQMQQMQNMQQGRPPHPQMGNKQPFEAQMGPPDMPGGQRPPSQMNTHPGSTPQQQPGTPANPTASPVVSHQAMTPQTPQLAEKKPTQSNSKKRSADNLPIKEPKKARNNKRDRDDSEVIVVNPPPDLAEVLASNKDNRMPNGGMPGNMDPNSFMEHIGGVTANGDLTSLGLESLTQSFNGSQVLTQTPDLDRNLWDMFVNDGMSASGSWDAHQ